MIYSKLKRCNFVLWKTIWKDLPGSTRDFGKASKERWHDQNMFKLINYTTQTIHYHVTFIHALSTWMADAWSKWYQWYLPSNPPSCRIPPPSRSWPRSHVARHGSRQITNRSDRSSENQRFANALQVPSCWKKKADFGSCKWFWWLGWEGCQIHWCLTKYMCF